MGARSPTADEPDLSTVPVRRWVQEPEQSLGPSVASREASPDSQGRVMDPHSAMVPAFVGINVAKDRLEVHLLPSGEASPSPVTAPAWSGRSHILPGGAYLGAIRGDRHEAAEVRSWLWAAC
jgi:hypothetical protein